VLGLTSWGARIVSSTSAVVGDRWWAQLLVGGLIILAIGRLVVLPFDVWLRHLALRVGLAAGSWAQWSVDVVKAFAIGAVLALGALLVLVALARRLPNTWWIPASVGAAVLVVILSFAYPVVFEPIFNRFTPMADGPLRTSLLDLAAKDGVSVSDVLVADASKRTTALNAYVSGFGATRRIVVYDTLVDGATPEEVRLVVAHELGHAKDNDVLHATLLGAAGAALAVILIFLLTGWSALLDRAGVRTAGDPGVIALILAIIAVMTLLVSPVESLISRRIEARADVHALNLTRDDTGANADTFARMQKRLAVRNLSDLDPPAWYYVWFYTHPSSPERLALVRSWAQLVGVPAPGDLAGQNTTMPPR
jgi:STE24 endopeptidase